jgi:hypothetical protein
MDGAARENNSPHPFMRAVSFLGYDLNKITELALPVSLRQTGQTSSEQANIRNVSASDFVPSGEKNLAHTEDGSWC